MQQLRIGISQQRLYEKLHCDIGDDIRHFLQDEATTEIMANPNGSLWIDQKELGQSQIGEIPSQRVQLIIRTVAGINGQVISEVHPHLETKFPLHRCMKGERFTAQIPPLVSAPCFSIRKRTNSVLTLMDYLSSNQLSKDQYFVLQQLIEERQNILVCGGPGSGKTTITSALLQESIARNSKQRFIILEDTPELFCQAENTVPLLTNKQMNMCALVSAAMRIRPDRILVGEVRGAEALDLMKAWNTGCPGGLATIHANDAPSAIQRVLDCAMESGLSEPPISLVTHTINAVVFVKREQNKSGYVQEIIAVKGFQDGRFKLEQLA